MGTKLLLIDDVECLGRKGDLVEVKPGYARNFLLPQGLAMSADKNALRVRARLQEERRQRAAQDRSESEAIKARIEGKIFLFEVKVDHDGHMYGSVSAPDIAHRIQEEEGVELDRRMVMLKHPLKSTGVHNVTLRLKEEVEAQVHVKILAEGTVEHEEAPAEGQEG